MCRMLHIKEWVVFAFFYCSGKNLIIILLRYTISRNYLLLSRGVNNYQTMSHTLEVIVSSIPFKEII